MNSITSIGPVKINGWILSGSILNNDVMCMVFVDTRTCNTIIRYFNDEEDALAYTRYVTSTDTSPL